MDQQLEDRFYKRWPHWFNRGNVSLSSMCFGMEVGNGWFPVLWDMCIKLEQRMNDKWYTKYQVLARLKVQAVRNKIVYTLSPVQKWGSGDLAWDEKLVKYFRGPCKLGFTIGIKRFADTTMKHGFEFIQIKEKFGTLRVYTRFQSFIWDDVIREACARSREFCENCGSTHNVTTFGDYWVRTRCEHCKGKMDVDSDE